MTITGLIHLKMSNGRPAWLRLAEAKEALRTGAATDAQLGGEWLAAAAALRVLSTRGFINGGPANRFTR